MSKGKPAPGSVISIHSLLGSVPTPFLTREGALAEIAKRRAKRELMPWEKEQAKVKKQAARRPIKRRRYKRRTERVEPFVGKEPPIAIATIHHPSKVRIVME